MKTELLIKARAAIGQGWDMQQFLMCFPKSKRGQAQKAWLQACSEGAVDYITVALNSLDADSHRSKQK